ncbi:MAG: hypothetical protein ACR2NX_04785 [Chthoniobacterales bacterium]
MKYKSPLLTAVCIAALAPALALGAPKKSASPKPEASPAASPMASSAEKAPRSIPFHGKATALDKKAQTFTIAGALNKRVFKVTGKTAVTKAGAPSKFAELTEGEEVSGSYWKEADGTLEARSLKIGGKTEAEKEAAAAAKAKKDAKKSETTAQRKEATAASPAPEESPKKK